MKEIGFSELEYQALKDALNNSTSNDGTPDSSKDNYSIDELRRLQEKQQEECLKPVVYYTECYFEGNE